MKTAPLSAGGIAGETEKTATLPVKPADKGPLPPE